VESKAVGSLRNIVPKAVAFRRRATTTIFLDGPNAARGEFVS
jgi:hypothetical protein